MNDMKYRLFGTQTGLYVSELILGGAMFGGSNGYGASKEEANDILKSYAEAGGNFIDTSDAYKNGESEKIIGDFLRPIRNDFVLSSKYTRSASQNPSLGMQGNNRKVMIHSVEESLKRLKTDRIDIYIAHFDDGITPVEEIERGLDDLVRSGKIVYGGLSNFPSWKVAAAIKAGVSGNRSSIIALQTEYSLIQRTPERELLPMSAYFGLGVMAYSPLSGGLLTGKYRNHETGRLNLVKKDDQVINQRHEAILDVLIEIASATGKDPGNVAIAWITAKGLFPVIGPRTLHHLEGYLKSLSLTLTTEQIQQLDKVSEIAAGYPHEINKAQAELLKSSFHIQP